jgi:hypothetical protein
MRFTQTLFAGAAFIAAAFAVEINEFPSEVQAGRSYRVTYTPGGDIPTTFILRKGKNEALDTLDTLTSMSSVPTSITCMNLTQTSHCHRW